MSHGLNVVLVEPQIPFNTGSVGRVCLATGAVLHLVEPLGFAITHAQLKRSGLDYWQYVQVVRHESLEAFWRTMPENAAKAFFSTKGRRSHFDHAYQPGAYLFFGNETCGLPDDLLRQHEDLVLRVPQYDTRVRSLNLSNVVSVVVYEAIRQLGA